MSKELILPPLVLPFWFSSKFFPLLTTVFSHAGGKPSAGSPCKGCPSVERRQGGQQEDTLSVLLICHMVKLKEQASEMKGVRSV